MTRSKTIDREESYPDCPECEHNLYVHAGSYHDWVCEWCDTEWGDDKPTGAVTTWPSDVTDHPTHDHIVAYLRDRLADQGSPTYVKSGAVADVVGAGANHAGFVLNRLDVDGFTVTRDGGSNYHGTRWRVEEVPDDE